VFLKRRSRWRRDSASAPASAPTRKFWTAIRALAEVRGADHRGDQESGRRAGHGLDIVPGADELRGFDRGEGLELVGDQAARAVGNGVAGLAAVEGQGRSRFRSAADAQSGEGFPGGATGGAEERDVGGEAGADEVEGGDRRRGLRPGVGPGRR
jgi:hypothetical protein